MAHIYTSPYGDVEKLYDGNVASFIRSSPHIIDKMDKEIFVDAKTEKGLSIKQTFELSGKISHVLRNNYNVKYDDVVCLFVPNHYTVPSIHYGILGLGAAVSPANIAYMPNELHHQLNVSGSSVIITIPQLRKTVEDAISSDPSPLNVTHIVDLEELIKQSFDKSVPSMAPVEFSPGEAKTKDAYYCFSSGTSGLPKGVMTTHFNVTSNILQVDFASNFTGEDHSGKVAIGFLPMSHMYGLMRLIFHVPYSGSKCITMPSFELELFLQCIVKYKIENLPVVPPIVVLLAKHPLVDKYPQVKEIVEELHCGAAPLSDSVIEKVKGRLNCAIKQGYGLTETSPVTHLSGYKPEIYNNRGVGWLAPSMTARIVDADGKDAPQGERGELWLKGPNIMKGYMKNAKATAETFSSDGWFMSGDVALVDETGQYYIVDRVKELIKSNGFQVAPAELEAILLSHPKVSDAAVIGYHIKDDATELPRAFLTFAEPKTDPLEIKSWFDAKVARHKRLWGGVVVLEAIPKSPSGKILRKDLRTRDDKEVHGYTKSKL